MKNVLVCALLTVFTYQAESAEYIVRTLFSLSEIRPIEQITELGLQLIDIEPEQAEAFRRRGLKVEPNRILRLVDEPAPSIQNAGAPEPFNWGVIAVRAPDVHSLPNGQGQGVTVCLVDTGVDFSHPTLQGVVTGGFNSVTGGTSIEDYRDRHGHGTSLASLIAGRSFQGFVGVAPASNIFAVKGLGDDGGGSIMDLIKGLQACRGRSQIINMSWGSGNSSDALTETLKQLKSEGMILVAAAGNSGTIGFPARLEEVIAVGAVDADLKITEFSSQGPELDVVAPGVGIDAASLDGSISRSAGTSLSTAFVSGVAALQLSRGRSSLQMRDLGNAADQQGRGFIDAFLTAGGN
jgi:subtilisin family serine protease